MCCNEKETGCSGCAGISEEWLISELNRLDEENEQLKQWVRDLSSGMYVNCVYCGHRYGPKEDTPTSMADILKEHIQQCPKHPMSDLRNKLEILEQQIIEFCGWLKVLNLHEAKNKVQAHGLGQ